MQTLLSSERKDCVKPAVVGRTTTGKNAILESTISGGHDSKMFSAIKEACGGDILAVRAVVERALETKIKWNLDD